MSGTHFAARIRVSPIFITAQLHMPEELRITAARVTVVGDLELLIEGPGMPAVERGCDAPLRTWVLFAGEQRGELGP